MSEPGIEPGTILYLPDSDSIQVFYLRILSLRTQVRVMAKRKRMQVTISPPPLLFSPPQSLVHARANLVLEEPDIAIEDPSELAVQSDAEAITQDTDDQHVITDDEEHISKQRPSSGIVLTFQKAIIDGHFPQFSGDISSPLGQEETGQTQGVYRSIITFLEAFDMKIKAFPVPTRCRLLTSRHY